MNYCFVHGCHCLFLPVLLYRWQASGVQGVGFDNMPCHRHVVAAPQGLQVQLHMGTAEPSKQSPGFPLTWKRPDGSGDDAARSLPHLKGREGHVVWPQCHPSITPQVVGLPETMSCWGGRWGDQVRWFVRKSMSIFQIGRHLPCRTDQSR